ncbi:helix-turn-helix domain-containing protein [Dyadobacter sp. 676]|uniref:Helix-turn-helix domain-containing protein n=1 Tax=Dyadobacter sp. 676 TaxID=3088362 RepID=A0AAU8FP80_9BACT
MVQHTDFPLHELPISRFMAAESGLAFGEHAPSHRISFFAIVWFSESGGTHFIDFESFPIVANEVFLLSPNQVHSIPAATLPPARTIVFARDVFDRIDEPYLRQMFLPFENTAFAIPADMVAPLTHLFDLILMEYGGEADISLLLKYTTALLTHLYRFGRHNHRIAGAGDHRLVKLFQLMQTHYRHEKSATFYARQIGLTPKRVNELLREKMGTTLSRLLYRLILIEAKRELYHGRHSVKEIAYRLGFSDQSYFARFFKKQTGLTPDEFRAGAGLKM